MTSHTTRRESLGLLGLGLSALSGCGGASGLGAAGGSASGGLAGDGSASGGLAPGAAGSDAVGGQGEASAGGAPSECASKNEATAGPYPNLSPLNRKDVRGNTVGLTTPKAGAPLLLRIRVLDLDAFCAPIEGAIADIWQCDALGVYASYQPFDTVAEDFLRGYQKTDAAGVAELLTIFPGSYAGRALHIHFSVRGAEGTLGPNASGPDLPDVFVAQLYFEQADAEAVFAAYPIYQQGAPITANASDGIYNVGGHDLIATLTETPTGYLGELTIGVSRATIGL